MPEHALTDEDGYELVDTGGLAVDENCPGCCSEPPPPPGDCCDDWDRVLENGRPQCLTRTLGAAPGPGSVRKFLVTRYSFTSQRRTQSAAIVWEFIANLPIGNIGGVPQYGPLPPASHQNFTVEPDETEVNRTATLVAPNCSISPVACNVWTVPVRIRYTQTVRVRRAVRVNLCDWSRAPVEYTTIDTRLEPYDYVTCEFMQVRAWHIPDPNQVGPLHPVRSCFSELLCGGPAENSTSRVVLPDGVVIDTIRTWSLDQDTHNRTERRTFSRYETGGRDGIPLEEIVCCVSETRDETCLSGAVTGRYLYRVSVRNSTRFDNEDQTCASGIAVRWSRECDGSPGSLGEDVCDERLCDTPPPQPPPPPGAYIVGLECRGAPGPMVVVPVENVLSCGVATIGTACYMFDPIAGPRVPQPPPGATIAPIIIDQSFPRTCCECVEQFNDNCKAHTVGFRTPWMNGRIVRDLDGVVVGFDTSGGFFSGRCCCSLSDVFTLDRAVQVWIMAMFPDGSPQTWQISEVVRPSDETLPSVFRFRRGFEFARYAVRTRILTADAPGQTPTVIYDQVTDIPEEVRGPVDCEWIGFRGPLGSDDTPINFDLPHHIRGMLINGQPDWKTPSELQSAPVPGFSNDWGLVRYDIAATCMFLHAEATWEKYADPGSWQQPIQRGHSIVIWRIDRDEASPCVGGCPDPVTFTPPGTDAPDTPPDAAPHRSGCSACGGAGL